MGEPAPQIIKAADLPPSEPTPEPEATTAEPLADAGSNEPAPLTMPEEEPEPAWLQDALKIEEDFHQSLRPNAETDFEDVTDEERDALFNKILELGVLHFQQKLEAGKRADEAYLEISDELKTVPAPESGWASEDLIVTNKEAIEKLLKEHPILKDSGLTFDIIRYWAYSANHPDMTPEGQEKLASPLADMSEQQIAGAVFNALPDGTGENAGHNMFEDDALEERAALTQQTPTQPESEAGEKLVNPDTLEPTTGGAKVEPETPFDLNVDVEEAPANTTSNGLITPSATNRTPEISGLIELPDEDMVEEPAEELLQTPAPAAEAAPKPTTTLPEDSTLIDLPALARAAVQDLGTRPTERAMPIVTEAPEVMVDVPGLETRRFADREFKNWVVATSGASVGQIDHLHPDRKNQDMFDAIPELGVYFVGDGMGGYAGGDIASQKTRELIHTYAPNFLAGTQTLEKKKQSIEELVSVVNSKLYEIKKSGDPTYARMGSTLTMLVLHENPDGTLYAINMNVGDSPAYVNYQNESDLFPVTSEDNPTTKGVLKKLKPDAAGRLIYALQNATSEEEFETLLPNDTERTGARDAFYNRNQIEQYIGMSRDPQPHILTLMIKDPVKFLLTSDGVSDQTTAIKLGELAKAARSPSELSQTAVEAGYDTAYRNQNMRTKVHRAYDGQDDYGDDTTALAVFVTPKQK